MFFHAHLNLSKRGPLGKIWIAAHWEKKLTKAQVYETNIESSVEAILQPRVKMALRTTGHLLLGVVRIYSRKANYLLADCNQAFVKIKMAFRPGVVDLDMNRESAMAATTLKDTFHDFDTDLDAFDIETVEIQKFNVNQGRLEEITMKEDLGQISIPHDDGFGDFGAMDEGDLQWGQGDADAASVARGSDAGGGSRAGGDVAASVTMDTGDRERQIEAMDQDDDGAGAMGGMDDDDYDGFGEEDGMDPEFLEQNLFAAPSTMAAESTVVGTGGETTAAPEGAEEATAAPAERPPLEPAVGGPSDMLEEAAARSVTDQTPAMGMSSMASDKLVTMVTCDEEAFALEPLDATSVIGSVVFADKRKKKRKLVVDKVKSIPSEAMKQQIADTSDIVTTLHLAPPFKKLMQWNETSGCDKLFALPGRYMPSPELRKLFTRNLSVLPTVARTREVDSGESSTAMLPPPPPDQLPQPEMPAVEPLPDLRDIVDETLVPAQSTLDSTAPELARAADNSLSTTAASDATLTTDNQSEFAKPDVPAKKRKLDLSAASHSLSEGLHDVTPMASVDFSGSMDTPEAMLAAAEAQARAQQAQESVAGVDPSHEEEDLDATLTSEGLKENGSAVNELEDKKLHKHSQQMVAAIDKAFQSAEGDQSEGVRFGQLTSRASTKLAAARFYTLLVLTKRRVVQVHQDAPYEEILINKGENFETALA